MSARAAEPALSLDGVVKRYGTFRKTLALDGASFTVPRGSVCGLIGPNGAGKTTVFASICGQLRLDAGRIEILGGGPFDVERLKGRVGLLPQDAELGLSHTPTELLVHLARLQGLGLADAREASARGLAQVDLSDRAERRIATLSHGMRRRLAIATALLGEPELVLLDEPMSGLDPAQVRSLRELVVSQRGRRTLVISSHNLAELEQVCDHVVLIDRGRCTLAGPIAEVTGRAMVLTWTLGPGELDVDALAGALPGHEVRREDGALTVVCPPDTDLDDTARVVARHCVEADVAIREVRRGLSLERSYLERTARRDG